MQSRAGSAEAELVQPLLVEAEAVRQLVGHGDLYLAAQGGGVVAVVRLQRAAVDGDQRRQRARRVLAQRGALVEAVEVLLAGRWIVLADHRDLVQVRLQPRRQRVERLGDELLKPLPRRPAGHGRQPSGAPPARCAAAGRGLYSPTYGAWRSLVAHPAGGRAVGGSNPLAPIDEKPAQAGFSPTRRRPLRL